MIDIRTLGGLDVRRPDGAEVGSVLAAPKRFAVLVYLAVRSPEGLQRRDSLLATFWPDKDARSARNSLNVTLHELRAELGREAIVSRGAELVAIDAEKVRCDAVEFFRALEDDQPEDAMALYAGEFLPGFHVPDSRTFERWLDRERERVRRGALQASRELARRADKTDPGASIRWLRRGLSIAPLDERMLRTLVERLDAMGERAGAIRAYEKFSLRLAAELQVSPSADTVRLVEEIRARSASVESGVRLEAPAAGQPAAPGQARHEGSPRRTGDEPPRAPGEARPPRTGERQSSAAMVRARSASLFERFRLSFTVLTLCLAATSLLIVGLIRGPREAASSAADGLDPNLIMVVPFEARGADLEYAGEGMVDLLAIGLTGEGGPRAVESGAALAAWRRIGAGEQWSGIIARDLGRATGAGRIIRGGIVAIPGGVQLTARLIDASTGKTISTGVSGAEIGEDGGNTLWEGAAELVAELLAGQLEGGRLLVASAAPPLPALRHYMAGRNAYRDGRIVEAVQHYKAALEQDSTFAYAALGYLEATLWPSAALEFNPARKWMHSLRDRLTPRDRTYMRALAGPDYPAASTSAETDEAIAEARFALPYRPEVRFLDADRKFHGDAGSSLDEAAAGLRRALELDPGFSVALHHLFLLALLRGDVSEAGRLAEQYERTFPRADHVRSMNWALAMARGDEGAVAEFWDDPTDLTQSELTDVFLWTYAFGFPLSEAQRVLAEAWRRGDAPPDFLRFYEYFTELNAGHPAVAARVRPNADPIVAALYSVGDSSSAADHARDLASRQDAPVAGDKWELSEQAHGTCVLEQWWLWQGRRSETLERSIERILEAERRAPQVEGRQNLHTCALLLRALEAVLWDTPDAETALARADSAFREGPGGPQAPYARLLLAKLFMRLGKAESALRNLRYRCRFCPGSVFFLADVLREEGRLAAVLGDHEGAVEAYQRYLALRGDPEPSVQPQVDSVRLELRNLLVRTRSPASDQSR